MSRSASILVTPESALIPVPSRSVGGAWDKSSPYLKRALDESEGDYTLGDVRRMLDAAEGQLWTVYENGVMSGAGVTKTVKGKVGLVCELWLYAGALPSNFLELLGEVETWAQAVGCVRMRVFGRRGWVRKLGWTERYTMADKCLTM